MHKRHLLISFLLISMVAVLIPKPAAAIPAATFVLGAMIGDSLSEVLQVRLTTVTEGFKNAPLFGGRLGWSIFPFAIEGSLLYSPSAIDSTGGDSFSASIMYAEVEAQLLILPGPVSPFLGGGIGLHSIKLQVGTTPRETVIGYVFGGGLRATFGTLGLRVDIKDHITPLEITELDPNFIDALGMAVSNNLHNIEFSGGVTIKF
ncbi:MAG TPA: hypothetical protein QGE93_03570 [Acidobacteriota bacterium]|jgi:hypothetical protein|nr:hypothetical protein [Acidobacteriota bacterium]MBO07531.1 hypothetical protein [Acidobacteriota bacterium]HJN47795.1 hypothetical protein [Acidobacteriota bacterium]